MTDSSEIRNGNRSHSSKAFGDSPDRDPVEELAAEFAERFRNGDNVSIDDYVNPVSYTHLTLPTIYAV